jgi:ribosome-associated translation inhibitor RaiA
MRLHKKRYRRTELKIKGDAPPSPIPVRVTFRHVDKSDALTNHIVEEVQKLGRYFHPILDCHVTVECPHHHRRRGMHYAIHLQISVPGGPLAITHDPATHTDALDLTSTLREPGPEKYRDVYVVLREAFDVARRQLEDRVRRDRDGEKRHRLPIDAG